MWTCVHVDIYICKYIYICELVNIQGMCIYVNIYIYKVLSGSHRCIGICVINTNSNDKNNNHSLRSYRKVTTHFWTTC